MINTMGNHKVNWKDIPWKKFHRHVYRLQKRIFKASQRGNVGDNATTSEVVDEILCRKMSSGS
jgi:hypothetical protein